MSRRSKGRRSVRGASRAAAEQRGALQPEIERLEARQLLTSVTYHGGPLIPNVAIETLYYGQGWATDPQLQQEANVLDGYFATITKSTFMNLLSEYSTANFTIGQGSFVDRDMVTGAGTPASGTIVDDTQIQSMIRSQISAGRLAAPAADRLIFVFTPSNVEVTDAGQNSIQDFAGYHSDFSTPQGTDVVYAVIPNPVGNGTVDGLNDFQTLTEVSSHELAEAITDPSSIVGGWYSNSNGDEIGDICVGSTGYLDDYAIQTIHSNLKNACILPTGANKTDPAHLSANSVTFVPTAGQTFSGIVATFTDTDPSLLLVNYAAQITWGDGTTSVGTISNDPNTPGLLDVSGSHTYNGTATGQSFPVSVPITALVDSTTVTAQSTATVTGPTLSATGATIAPSNGVAFSGAVASFTDTASGVPASTFSATIAWGDGSTTNGTVSATSATGYSVTGTHTYTVEDQSLPVVVTISNANGLVVARGTANVADAQLSASTATIAASQGAPFSGSVASFTDADPNGSVAQFSATIAWGDGSTSTGTVSANGAAEFNVSGSHTYAQTSSGLTVTVAITDVGGATATASSTATVAKSPISVTGKGFAAARGSASSGVVASFTDSNSSANAGNLSATIAWGDGSSSSGSVTANGAGFLVSGTHAYSSDGNDTISLVITDPTGATAPGTATAQVTDPAVVVTGGFTFSAVEGTPSGSQAVASLTDPGGAQAASNYQATINWGDGSSAPGSIGLIGSVFTVAGTHTYADDGHDTITVTANHLGAPTASSTSSATVGDAPIAAVGRAIGPLNSLSFRGVVATITDSNPDGSASDFSATINWGDGTTSAGSVASGGSGGFSVSGVHGYSVDGTYGATVSIADRGGASAPAASTIAIAVSATDDFNGAGRSQLAVFRPSTAQWFIGGAAQPLSFGAPNLVDIPVPGDYDGVGHSELAVFRPSTAQWFIAGHAQPIAFGAPNLFDIPVPGDYDGVGHSELAVFRPSTAQWFIAGHAQPIAFGAPNLFDIPVPGDYDGVGHTELAVFRPSSAQWFIYDPATGKQRTISFGAPNLFDIPVPGDYDGIGRTELAVFRPSTAQWFILNPITGTVRVASFGAPNLFDIPVATSVGSLVKLGVAGGLSIQAQGIRSAPAAAASPQANVVIAIAPSNTQAIDSTEPVDLTRRNAKTRAAHPAALNALAAGR